MWDIAIQNSWLLPHGLAKLCHYALCKDQEGIIGGWNPLLDVAREGEIFSFLLSPRPGKSIEKKIWKQASLGLKRDIRDFREYDVCKENIKGQGISM